MGEKMNMAKYEAMEMDTFVDCGGVVVLWIVDNEGRASDVNPDTDVF